VYGLPVQAFEALPVRYQVPVVREFADQLAEVREDARRRQALAQEIAKAMREAIERAQEEDDEEIFLLAA
jgi:hypothetical protein